MLTLLFFVFLSDLSKNPMLHSRAFPMILVQNDYTLLPTKKVGISRNSVVKNRYSFINLFKFMGN